MAAAVKEPDHCVVAEAHRYACPPSPPPPESTLLAPRRPVIITISLDPVALAGRGDLLDSLAEDPPSAAAAAGRRPEQDGLVAAEAPELASQSRRLGPMRQNSPPPSPPNQHNPQLALTPNEQRRRCSGPEAKVLHRPPDAPGFSPVMRHRGSLPAACGDLVMAKGQGIGCASASGELPPHPAAQRLDYVPGILEGVWAPLRYPGHALAMPGSTSSNTRSGSMSLAAPAGGVTSVTTARPHRGSQERDRDRLARVSGLS